MLCVQQLCQDRIFKLITIIIKMIKRCQVCPKQAYFSCSRCENALYCSKEHQIDHWKSSHKQNCYANRQKFDELEKALMNKRFHARKQFFDNYSNKVFDLCLLDAKVMVDIDKKIKLITRDIMDQFQYGAAVCLLCRSYYLVKDKNSARIIIQNYLAQSHDFLSDLQTTPDANKNLLDRQRQIFQRKMNLISTIANLCFALQLDCIKYYVLYTKHIQKSFGKQSFQASNCYFLIGCYFAEEGFLKKAIACFKKSAACRGQLAGDCYFNIGVLYSFQKKWTKALSMFESALKFRMEQYGEDSDQLAEVQQNTGMIYVELNDFVTAMLEYEKAFKIRSINLYSAQYRNLIDLIHELYDKLDLYINTQQDNLKKASIYQHLKEKIQQQDIYWKEREEKKKTIKREQEEGSEQTKPKKKINEIVVEQNEDKKKNDSLLVISEQLMAHLNPSQLFQLSDLQLELSSCESIFASVFMVGKSQFLHKISPQNLAILKKDNARLFQLLRLQQLERKRK